MSASTKHRKLGAIMLSGVIGDVVLAEKPISAPPASVSANDAPRDSGTAIATSARLPADFRICQ
jgi:hypothetical protein